MRFFRRSNKGSSLQETSQQLDAKIASVDKKIKNCNAELASIKALLDTCKGPGAVAAAKRKAYQVLQRRKVYETQREQLSNVLLAVDQCEHISSQVQTAVDMRNALSSSIKTTQKQLKDAKLGDLERLQDEMEDLQDYTNDIHESFDHSYSIPDFMDEDELELELSTLDDTDASASSGIGMYGGIVDRLNGRLSLSQHCQYLAGNVASNVEGICSSHCLPHVALGVAIPSPPKVDATAQQNDSKIQN
ncbi:Charged multivesicular body protein 5 [Babesia sp. Xinjiang]|uniref:Charged multivesicular body protein 5 n=1 Tax=Babesia sp. Xinjiang TaxID=462227 RepID=UPI000A26003E|nr:Charged multivesicular body protein 5 [Babesia sp. Xinjiang]ORM40627.1 Charged multivesicular body protein 5 [Babesia sp. Xinjiang]